MYACAVLGEPPSCKYLPFAQSWPAAETAADRPGGQDEEAGERGDGKLAGLACTYGRGVGRGQREAKQIQASGGPSGKYVLFRCGHTKQSTRVAPSPSTFVSSVAFAIRETLVLNRRFCAHTPQLQRTLDNIGDIFSCHILGGEMGVLLVSIGYRPEMLLNMVQSRRELPTTKNNRAQNVNASQGKL